MHKIKVRWVILNKDKVFLVREIKKHFFYLPWWTLEWWESFKECLNREIKEELWITPIIWNLINIEEFKNDNWFFLDVWFEIKNYKNFENLNKNTTSHWFEYYDEWFYSFDELIWKDVRPYNIKEILDKKINIKTI